MATPERPAFVLDAFEHKHKMYWIVPSMGQKAAICDECVADGRTVVDQTLCGSAPCGKDKNCRHDESIDSIVIDPDQVEEYLLARVNQKLHT